MKDLLKNSWRTGLLTVVCALVLCACHKSDPIEPLPGRTVLVYMAADNSLSSDGYTNIKQMLEGMKHTSGRLVIYFDPLNDVPRLFTIEGGRAARLDTLQVYEEENSASVEVLARVIEDTRRLYPHDSYGLILWSHGMGWLPGNWYFPRTWTSRARESSFLRTKYIGTDDHTGHTGQRNGYLEIGELLRAMPGGFDFILFDACFMSSVEVLYELRNKADYFIASPAEIISNGFPYEKIMSYLWGGEENYRQMCSTFFDFYNDHEDPYKVGWKSATVALVKSAELNGLMAVTRDILKGHTDFLDISAWSYPLSAGSLPDVFFDLGDYIRQMATTEQYRIFEEQLDRTVVYKAATPEFFFQPIPPDKFSGLSTYIPLAKWEDMNRVYYNFEWPQLVYEY